MEILSCVLNGLLTAAALAAGMWGSSGTVKSSDGRGRSEERGRLVLPSYGRVCHQPMPASAADRSVARPSLTAAGSCSGTDPARRYDSKGLEEPEAHGDAPAIPDVLAPTITECASLTQTRAQPRSTS
jgi:hypothetical protein